MTKEKNKYMKYTSLLYQKRGIKRYKGHHQPHSQELSNQLTPIKVIRLMIEKDYSKDMVLAGMMKVIEKAEFGILAVGEELRKEEK